MNGCEMERYSASQLRMCSLDDDDTTSIRSISFHYLKVSSATKLPTHVRASDADKDQHRNCQIIPKHYFEHDATRHQSVAASAKTHSDGKSIDKIKPHSLYVFRCCFFFQITVLTHFACIILACCSYTFDFSNGFTNLGRLESNHESLDEAVAHAGLVFFLILAL